MAQPDLTKREEQRENWGTRAGFVLAAVGSAVGLGNLWGFPYKLYDNGGGAFLIPYIIAMVLIGIPLLIAEFSLGHLTQRATPDAFGRANRKFAFVGWWQIILSFIIVTYYGVILAWCLSFLYYSVVGIFSGSLPWAGEGVEGVANTKSFFFDDYLSWNGGFSLGWLQLHVLGAMVIVWALMYLCIFRGVKLVGKVVLWTVPVPWLMLLILTIRGLTLDGAMQGLEYYLEPNWTQLSDPGTWRWAFGQMFFSMSIAFGIMITYASFLHRKSDLNNNASIIGLADLGTSFVAGLAVFATLGGMAFATAAAGNAVPLEEVADKGPSLAFVAFPYALAQLPHAPWFSAVFFISLLLLGIDSAFSITESVLASLVDKTGWNRDKTLIGLSLSGMAIGVLYTFQSGLSWLGAIDTFINGTWGITLTALIACLVLGWLFRVKRLRDHANERSDWRLGVWWDVAMRLVIPIVLAALFSWSLLDNLKDPKGYVFQYKAGEVAEAYDYEAGEVALHLPPAEELPPDPQLEIQLIAAFSGEPEKQVSLAPELADAAEPNAEQSTTQPTEEEWLTGLYYAGDPAPQKVHQPIRPEQLTGRELVYVASALNPNTQYTVKARWTQKPSINSETGLPKPVPDRLQGEWQTLGPVATGRIRTGVNPGNLAGVVLMAVAPLLAIAISAIKFRRQPAEPIRVHYVDGRPWGQRSGTAAVLLAGVGFLVSIYAFVHLLLAARDLRAGASVEQTALMVAPDRWRQFIEE
ncbi:MAG: sodium-dependent transporter, partial [Planctomycetota bacterium]